MSVLEAVEAVPGHLTPNVLGRLHSRALRTIVEVVAGRQAVVTRHFRPGFRTVFDVMAGLLAIVANDPFLLERRHRRVVLVRMRLVSGFGAAVDVVSLLVAIVARDLQFRTNRIRTVLDVVAGRAAVVAHDDGPETGRLAQGALFVLPRFRTVLGLVSGCAATPANDPFLLRTVAEVVAPQVALHALDAVPRPVLEAAAVLALPQRTVLEGVVGLLALEAALRLGRRLLVQQPVVVPAAPADGARQVGLAIVARVTHFQALTAVRGSFPDVNPPVGDVHLQKEITVRRVVAFGVAHEANDGPGLFLGLGARDGFFDAVQERVVEFDAAVDQTRHQFFARRVVQLTQTALAGLGLLQDLHFELQGHVDKHRAISVRVVLVDGPAGLTVGDLLAKVFLLDAVQVRVVVERAAVDVARLFALAVAQHVVGFQAIDANVRKLLNQLLALIQPPPHETGTLQDQRVLGGPTAHAVHTGSVLFFGEMQQVVVRRFATLIAALVVGAFALSFVVETQALGAGVVLLHVRPPLLRCHELEDFAHVDVVVADAACQTSRDDFLFLLAGFLLGLHWRPFHGRRRSCGR